MSADTQDLKVFEGIIAFVDAKEKEHLYSVGRISSTNYGKKKLLPRSGVIGNNRESGTHATKEDKVE